MIQFETVCEKMYKNYRRCGYPGIGGIGDTGKEWVFVQAPEEKDGELPYGDHPIFVNKDTGESRRMVFDLPDIKLLNSAKPVTVPEQYQPVY